MTNDQAEQILRELVMLRKLRLMELLEKGFSQAQIAQALGMSQPTISRMMPKVSAKKRSNDKQNDADERTNHDD